MAIEVRNPAFAADARANFGRQAFMRLLGAGIADLGPGYCEVHLPFRQDLTQQHGYFHGGVAATLADVASGYAAFTALEAGVTNVTVEFKLNLLAPARGAKLVARGTVAKAGQTLTVCRSDVFGEEDQARTLRATALTTFMALPSGS
jgi:uncharacterized protein (TIGR00369 family)